MKSVYREKKWLEVNEKKEGGISKEIVFEENFGRIVYRYIKKSAGEIDGIEYFDISSYRGAEGPYIEWVNDGKEEKLLSDFVNYFEYYCQTENIIAEFAKLDPWDRYAESLLKVYGAKHYGYFYCNNLQVDFYKEEYNRRAKRSIKKAKNAGIIVSKDFTGETISKFVELYKNTEDKFQTSEYYKMSVEDIQKFFEVFGDDAFLINAHLESEIITSVLVVMGEDIEHYLLLGSNPKYLDLQANSLLTYEAALYGQQLGKKLFDMGGGKPGSGVEQFKRNFSSEKGIYPYYALEKVHNKKIYNYLVSNKKEIKNTNFFPLYRG